ncbi:hypothetical protein [Agarivorans sp. JK6]|uniref:hypothetical protein n=1 Tax=Agarivorans sp. JK6 TaxID=2997426 RepID=UPI00387356CC
MNDDHRLPKSRYNVMRRCKYWLEVNHPTKSLHPAEAYEDVTIFDSKGGAPRVVNFEEFARNEAKVLKPHECIANPSDGRKNSKNYPHRAESNKLSS